MTFHDWLYSVYPPNSDINGRWGMLHIITLILCVLVIGLIIPMKNKDLRVRQGVIMIIASLIFLLEITRRGINISRGVEGITSWLHVLLPRPWCAISCWTLMLSSVLRKKWLYNFASTCALLNALVFFAYPSVGFNHNVILFENLYSILTHSLLLVGSISLMTLRLAEFKTDKSIIKEAIVFLLVLVYVFMEIYVLKIESDPMYFMPGNEVQAVLGVGYGMYLVIYVGFLAIYFSLFRIVAWIIRKRKNSLTI